MAHAVVRKLHQYESLSADDARMLSELLCDRKAFLGHADIVRDGDRTDFALAILSGWAFRHKVLRDGSRQITAFLLPGDFCHLNALAGAPMDHGIAALTPVTIARIGRSQIERLVTGHPHVAKAIQVSQFADEARLRTSIISLGRKDAAKRVGYLLCDLWGRADAIGLMDHDCLDFAPTQADIADAVGLTPVHVNRVLRRLREMGLVTLSGRCLTILEFDQLARMCGYEVSAFVTRRASMAPRPVMLHGAAYRAAERLTLAGSEA